jgi:polyisoprenoid-binding protein YceI
MLRSVITKVTTNVETTLATTLKTVGPIAVALAALSTQAADYNVDGSHSKVGFSVRHMMVTDVEGKFREFEGTFNFDPVKGVLGSTNFSVKTKSIDTDNDKRDEHLRSGEFFDVDKFPSMTVTNSKIKSIGKNKYKWTGDLAIRGVSKPVKFDLSFNGLSKDPWGNSRAGFTATTTIKRSDYGLTWNKALETGGVAVSDEVRIQLAISAIEAKTEAPKTAEAASQTETKKN